MEYVACLKVALNDIKALINLESNRKKHITPLLEMRGKETDKHFKSFQDNWGDTPFFLDFSSTELEDKTKTEWISQLLSAEQAFSNKRDFFDEARKNSTFIPVISWQPNDSSREVVQFSLKVEQQFNELAIRVNMNSSSAWQVACSILDSLSSPSNTTIILDFQDKSREITTESSKATGNKISTLSAYSPKRLVLLSTSFPSQKPAANSTASVASLDYSVQHLIKSASKISCPVIYGDYAASNPFDTIDFIPGMIILPFACYFYPFEWWMRRLGGNKEFIKYRDIAKEIRVLPYYHGDNYCWATKEIARIATLTPSDDQGHGANGTWNGYKSNQHMCVMLDYLQSPVSSPTGSLDDFDE